MRKEKRRKGIKRERLENTGIEKPREDNRKKEAKQTTQAE